MQRLLPLIAILCTAALSTSKLRIQIQTPGTRYPCSSLLPSGGLPRTCALSPKGLQDLESIGDNLRSELIENAHPMLDYYYNAD